MMWQKAAMNKILKVLFSPSNMARIAEPAIRKGRGQITELGLPLEVLQPISWSRLGNVFLQQAAASNRRSKTLCADTEA